MAPDVEKYTQRYLKQRNIDDMEWTPGTLILMAGAAACVEQETC